MAKGEIRSRIETILENELRIVAPTDDVDLLESGTLDSLSLVDLIAAMERAFGIVVDLIDLDLDDVRTIGSLTRLVEVRLQSQRPIPIDRIGA
jgi:acyl carrier protein